MLDKIRQNHLYADRLGWTPHDFGAEVIDAALVDAVTRIQFGLGVLADGIAGPATYGAQIDRRIADLIAHRATSTDWLRDAGEVALLTLKRVWLEGVIDPPTTDPSYASSRARIDQVTP